MDVVRGAVAPHAPKDTGSGQTGLVGAVDDLGRQRSVVVVVGLADEDGEALLVAFELHAVPPRCGKGTVRATQIPAHTATNPVTRLAARKRSGDGGVALLDEQVALDCERRVRGVGPQEPGGDEGAQVARGREALDCQRHDQSEHEAARDVGHERRPREGVGRNVDHLGDAVAGGGPQSRSEGDRHEHRHPDPPRAHGAAGARGIGPGPLGGVGRRQGGVDGQLLAGGVVPLANGSPGPLGDRAVAPNRGSRGSVGQTPPGAAPPSWDNARMDQRLSLITLGVRDLGRARTFYEALGWRSDARPDDDVVFFQAPSMIVALWDRARLAEDSAVEDTGGWGGVTLAYNTRDQAEVDAVIADVRRRGDDRQGTRDDVLGRVLRGLHRPRRPSLGSGPQPRLAYRRRGAREHRRTVNLLIARFGETAVACVSEFVFDR